MSTVTPSILFPKAPSKSPSLVNTTNNHSGSSFVQSPRFSGDAFEIRKRLQQAAQEAKKAAQEAAQKKEDDAFKAICDTVVWRDEKTGETLNIAEMVAYLCRIREYEHYPGYGSVQALGDGFPGMDIEALREGFEKLHNATNNPCYLGKSCNKDYWLRPNGEEMIQKLYPDITLPPGEDRFTQCHSKSTPMKI